MIEFLIKLLIFTQIPVFFIFASRFFLEQITYVAFKKNPEWVVAHPEFKPHLLYTNVWLGFSYVLAALTFIAAVKFTLITPILEPMTLVDWLLRGPIFLWGMSLMLYSGVFYLRIVKRIPAPVRRKASLADRQLSAYVPLWVVFLGYGLLSLVVTVYLWGWMSGAIDSNIAIKNLFRFSLVLVTMPFSLLVVLRSKHTAGEQIFGGNGRRGEIMLGIGVLYLVSIVGIHRILIDFFSISLFPPAGLAVALMSSLQILAVVAMLNPKVRSLHRDYRRKYLPEGEGASTPQ